jgi:hypothetical protein
VALAGNKLWFFHSVVLPLNPQIYSKSQSSQILWGPARFFRQWGPRTIFSDPNHQKFPIVDYYQKSKYQTISKYPRISKYHDWGVLGEQQHTPSIGRKV